MGYDSPLAAFPSFLLCNFFFFFASILIISAPGSASKGSMPLCLSNQSSALLQFKRGIVLRPGMLSSWKKGTDCCDWGGVTCDSLTGSVTALQIPNVSVDGFYNSSRLDPSLFELSHLRVLDLGSNGFDGTIPKRLVELTHLTHLDLSNCHFSGAVPTEISQLTRLVYLNLSRNDGLQLENNSFTNLVGGLRRLQHLALNGVNISTSGKSMSTVVSSSMPDLQTLSLPDCNVFGTMDESNPQLRSLTYIDLSGNYILSIPESFQNFTSMEVLDLSCNHLTGVKPVELSALTSLAILNLSYNDLWGQIPQGNQFSTFEESSFEGNPGLCGPQLPQRPCSRGRDDPGVHQQTSVDWEKYWEYGALGIGFAVGLLLITLSILFSERLSNWYWNLIDRMAQFLMQVLFCKAFKRLHHAG